MIRQRFYIIKNCKDNNTGLQLPAVIGGFNNTPYNQLS